MLPKHGHFDLPETEASEAPINLVGYATHRSYALHAMGLNAMGADEVAQNINANAAQICWEEWGDLTDDDLDRVEGVREQLAGRIQERYGIAREEAERRVDEWARRVG